MISLTLEASASEGLSFTQSVMKDYRRSNNFKSFLVKVIGKNNKSDLEFIEQQFKMFPDLEKDTSLPSLTLENNMFTVREGMRASTWRLINRVTGEFEINKQPIQLSKWDSASFRHSVIAEALAKKKVSHFHLLPVAWANANSGSSKSSLILMAFTTRVLGEDGHLEVAFGQGKKTVNDLLVAVKRSSGSKCSQEYVLNFSNKVKESILSGSTVFCHNKKDLFFDLKQNRVLRVKNDGYDILTTKTHNMTEWFDPKTAPNAESAINSAAFSKILSDSNIKDFCQVCGSFVNPLQESEENFISTEPPTGEK